MRSAIALLVLLLGLAANAANADRSTTTASPADLLGAALEDIHASRPDSALANVDRAIAMQPDFKLAYLVKGDLLMAKSGNLAGFGPAAPANRTLEDLKDEARVRLLSQLDQPDPDKLPAQILQLAPSQRYALLADASKARIYVFENQDGEPHLVRNYYLSLGKNGVGKQSEGDKRSPLGVYALSQPISPTQLPPFYGAGAFPLNYPNALDQAEGKDGHGIWLHGVPPDTYSRPPKTSDGCLVVTNPDWRDLARYISPGNTPLVITRQVEWLDRDAWQARKQALLDAVYGWKHDWEALDANAYLAHYSPDYLNKLGPSWRDSKTRNIVQKDWIKVGLTDLSLFEYDRNEMATIEFTQSYSSDKHSDITHKSIYLKRDGSQWRIVLEKALQSAPAVTASN